MNPNKTKTLSVVIPSFNAKDLLSNCLDSLMDGFDTVNDEIIVVENNSEDGSSELVKDKYPQVHLIEMGRNAGFAAACNAGYHASHGDVILFANSDLEFPQNSILELKNKIFGNPNIGMLSPQLRSKEGYLIQLSHDWKPTFFSELFRRILSPTYLRQYSILRTFVEWTERKPIEAEILSGACLLVRRDVLNKLNGFDGNFELYFEDIDLCLRSRNAGYKLYFNPQIQVVHYLGKSSEKLGKRLELIYRQSQVYFYRKHNSRFQLGLLKIYLAIKIFFGNIFHQDKENYKNLKNVLWENEKFYLDSKSKVKP